MAAPAMQRLAISDIVLWELAMLNRKGRLVMDLYGPEFGVWLRNLTIIPYVGNRAQEHSARFLFRPRR